MSDLRETVLKAIEHNINRRPMIDSSQAHIRSIVAGWIADAVLAAIRKDHAIVGRTETMVDAGKLAAEAVNEELCRRLTSGEEPRDTHKLTSMLVSVAAPIIAAHARDAALEEAAKSCDAQAKDWNAYRDHENQGYAASECAKAVRALKSGGQARG